MRVTRFDAAMLYALNAVALWISYTSLADLALRAGLGERQAAAWPLVVDGLILTATRAVVTFGRHDARRYAWTLLGCAAVVSIAANAAHALLPQGPVHPAIAALVAVVPPVAALAMTHLAVVRARVRQDATQDDAPDASPQVEDVTPPDAPTLNEGDRRVTDAPVDTVEIRHAAPDASPSGEAVSNEDAAAADESGCRVNAATTDAVLSAPDAQLDADVRQQILDLLTEGTLSGRAIARKVGVSERTVRRYRDAAQETAAA